MSASSVQAATAALRLARNHDLHDRDWLRSLHEELAPLLDRDGKGTVSALYRCPDPSVEVEGRFLIGDMPDALVRVFFEDVSALGTTYQADSLFSRTLYRGAEVRGWSDIPGVRRGELRANGVEDILAVNSLDPDGEGVWFGSFQASREPLPEDDLVLLAHVARHVAACHRLRRRATGDVGLTDLADAVMRPDGTLIHARSAARTDPARRALARAARAFVSLDDAGKRASADQVLCCEPVIAGKWSLVDWNDAGGRRYVLAVPSGGPAAALSPREQQIVERTRAGESSKAIASALGISHSTVRVLLSRAYQKLGVTSRRSLAQAAGRDGSVGAPLDDVACFGGPSLREPTH